jgi:hypothetical protein
MVFFMRKAVFIAVSIFSMAASAQEVLQCTNPDILNGLVFLGRSEMKMTVTLGSSGFMASFRAPEGFRLIGSAVREEGSSSVVAYKTALPGDKAYSALLAAFEAEGWAIEGVRGSGAMFNVAGGHSEGTICRNGERRALLATEAGGQAYVSINAGRTDARNCNAPDLISMRPGNGMPRFQFPAGTSLAQGGGGGGGSNRNYTTTSRIISTEAAAQLVQHLAPQIETQGWSRDSGWAGVGSAGSTWRKTIEGESAIGVLEIIRVSEGTYEVNFTINLPG